MESFDIDVSLTTGNFTLSVIPYEYPKESSNTAFEIISEKVWVGSVFINGEYLWESFGNLPWDHNDTLKIGYEITNHYFKVDT